ncbi:hypothetical protein [Pseudozobellia thermophila]|uniref:Dolichyl-phosphate-mannose-protein mannosyltransferase n=1 Tax=Pseudozobellia thermophila TaxID=192903 RepID=A0A1M6FAB3_9FLAO|nr:hypothetical protein [Pseudozobellia thermophila]SHI94694.1 hypothetical protein SAMN04488513_102354 [Pseudozobellia thermophila]
MFYRFFSHRFLPYWVAISATLSILCIHMLPAVDSMLNENNVKISHVFLQSQIDYHKELPPFARRPFTTLLIDGATKNLGIRAGHSFILINFLLMFASGILLYLLSIQLKASRKTALANMLLYFSSFSILFAFFPPVFSYDEPLQYCLIFASLTLFFKQRWKWFAILFTLSAITRETSLILLPALAYLAFNDQVFNNGEPGRKKAKKLAYLLVPVLAYLVYLGIFLWTNKLVGHAQNEMASRYSCFLENFENRKNTIESITSLYAVLALPVYLTLFHYKEKGAKKRDKDFIKAFWITAMINTPIVILTAFARESRLFALPLLLLWPVFFQLFANDLTPLFSKNSLRNWIKSKTSLLVFAGLTLGNFLFCFKLYADLGLGANNFYQEYLFVLNLVLSYHVSYVLPKRKAPEK